MTEHHEVVGHDAWLAARAALLAKEKEFTRSRDELSRQRRELPWEAVGKEYVFDGPNGKQTLAELFDGRSQLIVYHFMFEPETDVGCPHCSFWADSFDLNVVHLNARDVTMVAVSRAPLAKLIPYRERMGWSFDWVSSFGSDFNYDYGVSFAPDELDDARLQLRHAEPGTRGPGRGECVLQGRGRDGVPHVLDLRARDRHAQRRLPLPRPRAEGSRRGGPSKPVLGAPS